MRAIKEFHRRDAEAQRKINGLGLDAGGSQAEHFSHVTIRRADFGGALSDAIEQMLGVHAALTEGHQCSNRVFLDMTETGHDRVCCGPSHDRRGKLRDFACELSNDLLCEAL